MRLLFVAPRYGASAVGAERSCEQYATRLAARDHVVEVATSCAGPAPDWADDHEPGAVPDGDVMIHRLPARGRRQERFFVPLRERVLGAPGPVAPVVAREWLRMRGPDLPSLPPWLQARSSEVDAVIFFSYEFATTYDGLHALTGLAPTVLHPFATDGPVLRLGVFDHMFRTADAFAWATEEEQRVVDRRFGVARPSVLTGTGVDGAAADGVVPDVDAFRHRLGLGNTPFLLAVDRTECGRDSARLVEMFAARPARPGTDVALVVLGQPATVVASGSRVVMTEAVDTATTHAAMSECLAVVEPSYDEDTVSVLLEAWAHRRPVLVDGRSAPLRACVGSSGGALPYRGFAEFDAGVDLLRTSPELAASLGQAGRLHVDDRYGWDPVLTRYEEFLRDVTVRWRSSTSSRRLSPG